MDDEEETPFDSIDISDSHEPEKKEENANLEDAFQSLFRTSASGTGEEELLRIASTFSMQITTRQMKALLYLEWASASQTPEMRKQITRFVSRWLEFKQHNNSDLFIMRALDSISLRKFVGENAFKVNIEK